jgi:hypothetical protein
MTNDKIIAAVSTVTISFVFICDSNYQVGRCKIPIKKNPYQIMA